MATIIEPVGNLGEAVRAGRAVPVPRPRIFLWLAIACAAVAIGGFMGTYWLQLPARTFRGPNLLHIHAGLATVWILFLISQSSMVVRGKVRNHRDWGLFGIALASALTVVALTVAISGMNERIAAGYGDAARPFLIVPLSAIGLFAGFTAAAIANVRRPEWHRRLMIVGTVSLIEAAAARIFFLMATGGGPGMRPGVLPPPPVSVGWPPAVLVELIIVAGMIRDWMVLKRVHPAWTIGLIVVGAVALLRIPVSATPAWLGFAGWLGHLAG